MLLRVLKFLIPMTVTCLPVIALAAAGDFLWHADLGGEQSTWSTPLLANTLVIVKGQDGGMTAFHVDTGEQAWYNAAIISDITSPILFGDAVYLRADTHLYKINPATGEVLLDRTLEGWADDRAPCALGDQLFFSVGTTEGHTLHAVSAETLADNWTLPLPRAGSTLTDGTNLYVLADALAALDPATGEQRWAISPPTGYDGFNEGAVAQGWIVAFASSDFGSDSLLTAWKFAIPDAAPQLAWSALFEGGLTDAAPPSIDMGRVFANSRLGTLRAYALSSGQLLWTRAVRGVGLATGLTAALDGKVYVQSLEDDLTMDCLDGASGTPLWSTPQSMGIAWGQPAVGDGRVYLATDWSGLYAFATGAHDHAWPMYKADPAQTSSSGVPAPQPVDAAAARSLLLLQ